MSADGAVSEVGQYQIVTINRGARDGIEIGHVLASYRRGAIVGGTDRTLGAGTWFKGMDVKPVPVVPDPPRALGAQQP